jgi:hypothetical protein
MHTAGLDGRYQHNTLEAAFFYFGLSSANGGLNECLPSNIADNLHDRLLLQP